MVDVLVLTYHLSRYYCSQKLMWSFTASCEVKTKRYVNESNFQNSEKIMQETFSSAVDCFS